MWNKGLKTAKKYIFVVLAGRVCMIWVITSDVRYKQMEVQPSISFKAGDINTRYMYILIRLSSRSV